MSTDRIRLKAIATTVAGLFAVAVAFASTSPVSADADQPTTVVAAQSTDQSGAATSNSWAW